MVHTICVKPLGAGWTVGAEGFDNEMLFLSGGRAETAARGLADKIAGTGEAAEIEIWLRDGKLATRFLCPPQAKVC